MRRTRLSLTLQRGRFAPAPAFMWALMIAVGLVACGPSRAGGRNILVITVDTTRADFVGAYGATLGVTPRLDALAEQGVVFENRLRAHAANVAFSRHFIHGPRAPAAPGSGEHLSTGQ